MMLSTTTSNDEQAAAQLLCQLKAVATKEVENVSIPYSCIDSFYPDPMEGRGRTVSVDSVDFGIKRISPVLGVPYVSKSSFLLDSPREKPIDHLDHHDWGPAAPKKIPRSPLIRTEEGPKHGKRKRESHVGLTTKSGIIRCTLRKKVSLLEFLSDSRHQVSDNISTFSHHPFRLISRLTVLLETIPRVGRLSFEEPRRILRVFLSQLHRRAEKVQQRFDSWVAGPRFE